MRILRVALIILLLIAVAVSGTSCFFKSSTTSTPVSDVASVQRGNLEITITATGNLALSEKEDLAFEAGGTVVSGAGSSSSKITVEEVLVEEGDVVKKGQVLAKLDTAAWQDYLDTLKTAVTTAQRQQTTKERALTAAHRQVDTKQSALETAQRQIPAKELALQEAQLNLQTAKYNLEQIAPVKIAQHNVDVAEAKVTMAQAELDNATKSYQPSGIITYQPTDPVTGLPIYSTGPQKGLPILPVDVDTLRIQVIEAQKVLAQAKSDLSDVIANSGVKFSNDVATDIKTKNLAVQQKQNAADEAQAAIDSAKTAVRTAQDAVEDARASVEDAQIALEDAKKTVADAQKKLDEALAKKTEIIAPFDGFITAVNATGGEEVNKGFVACVIADPNKFESYVMVGEMDIAKVKIGGDATVSLDSLGGTSFPAKVTHIAPTATVQSGVVNFKVKVELTSITPIQSSRQSTTPGVPSGQASGQTRQGATSGQAAGQARQGTVSQQATAPAVSSQNIQLREGLTATVNILVDKRDNVLLVPNRALTTEGQQTYVQVVSASGATEKRSVAKGISNWQYTEITNGLSEGENVVITRSTTATTSTSSSQQRPPQPMIIPMGGR